MTASQIDWAELPPHGGDVAWAARAFGVPQGEWLDLSTGVNPRPYPDVALDPGALATLPGRAAVDRLLAAARTAYGVPDAGGILAVPGSQAVIDAMPQAFPAVEDVAILSPTYSGHAQAWTRAGRAVVATRDFARLGDATVAVVVSPNNPDGAIWPHKDLLALAAKLDRKGGALILDEAFADTRPETSLVPDCTAPGVIILRSFGKFYGLAGLRLGFVLGGNAVIDRLSERFGPWAVSGPALEIGARALADPNWQSETRTALVTSADTLDALLGRFDLPVVGGTPLFRLVEAKDPLALFNRLGSRGILTRIFPGQRTWTRIGLPGSAQDFDRLEKALLQGVS